MKNHAWKSYFLWIALSETAGLLSAFLTRDGTIIFTETVRQPPLSPPAIVFPVAWTILYALMGIGIARISLSSSSADRTRSLTLFLTQLLVNFLWSPIFFNLQAYAAAFFWLLLLWVLVLRMILSFQKVDSLAAVLQYPYLLWLTFAAYLNLGVWLLN